MAMELKKTRQILKALGDDTRLRVIKLLEQRPLSVTELTQILDVSQPNLSKHLTKMRLTGIVGDRREGMNVFYYLASSKDKEQHKLVANVATFLDDDKNCVNDSKNLESLYNQK